MAYAGKGYRGCEGEDGGYGAGRVRGGLTAWSTLVVGEERPVGKKARVGGGGVFGRLWGARV